MTSVDEASVTQYLIDEDIINGIMQSSEHSLDVESVEKGEKLNFDDDHTDKNFNFLIT